ncbi:MAG: enoyl-CoA hydratase/isomerase family protein [Polyangiales bacterium]
MIRLHRDGHVAVVALDDPARRNAMTPELGDALSKVVADLRKDTSVLAVVLTGSGDVFSGGGDLRMLENLRKVSREEARDFMLGFYARYLSILDLEVPTISAVHGAAIGAGLCLAIACDLCIVEEDAKLAFNFVQLGLHPGMGATYLLPRRVGAPVAAELLLTGRRFDGREADRLNVALRAVPKDHALGEAIAEAKKIAANGPIAIRGLTKALSVDRKALDAALAFEAEQQALNYGSADLAEGLVAATQKRPPRFSGT